LATLRYSLGLFPYFLFGINGLFLSGALLPFFSLLLAWGHYHDLAGAHLLDEALSIEVLFQLVVRDLDGLPRLTLVDEDITARRCSVVILKSPL